jgi:hypothetical protein
MPAVPDALEYVAVGLGVLGALTGTASLVYVRRQAESAQRTAESSLRLAILGAASGLGTQFRDTRARFRDHSKLADEWIASRPDIGEVVGKVGSLHTFVILRDAQDTMQDVYFLRLAGCVPDYYWHVWTHSFFQFYAAMPSFRAVFEWAATRGPLHPEFVAFYEPAFRGETLADPYTKPA